MTPQRTPTARENLQKGIQKMHKSMSAAAQVRRDFRLGRPPKAGDGLPLHPAVVWQKATDALTNFRARMTAANLDPRHAEAVVVYVEPANPTAPRFMPIEAAGKTPDEMRAALVAGLSGEAVALGMLFTQLDEAAPGGKQQATFPYQFMGLSAAGSEVLKQAATAQHQGMALVKNAN